MLRRLGNGQERETAVKHNKKRVKYDPLAEFRNAATDSESRKKSSSLTAEVYEELHCNSFIIGVNLKQAHAVRAYLILYCSGASKDAVSWF